MSGSGSGLSIVSETPGGGGPSGEDIVARVVSFFAGLSTPAFAGIVGGAGFFLVLIVVLFTVASIALL